jgi:hypothetical protein
VDGIWNLKFLVFFNLLTSNGQKWSNLYSNSRIRIQMIQFKFKWSISRRHLTTAHWLQWWAVVRAVPPTRPSSSQAVAYHPHALPSQPGRALSPATRTRLTVGELVAAPLSGLPMLCPGRQMHAWAGTHARARAAKSRRQTNGYQLENDSGLDWSLFKAALLDGDV